LTYLKGIKATSKNVIPAKAGIQKLLTSLDSRLRGSDKLIIIRASFKNQELFPHLFSRTDFSTFSDFLSQIKFLINFNKLGGISTRILHFFHFNF